MPGLFLLSRRGGLVFLLCESVLDGENFEWIAFDGTVCKLFQDYLSDFIVLEENRNFSQKFHTFATFLYISQDLNDFS